MESKIYAIYDNKADAFMQPYFAGTAGLALRIFADNVNNPDTMLNKHPNDFCLYEIGVFDDATGNIENYTENHNLGLAVQYLEQPPKIPQLQEVK